MSDWSSAQQVLGNSVLSVILPVYHLPDVIEKNLSIVVDCLDAAKIHYELVPVDDGSLDGTAEALQRSQQKRSDVIHPVFVAHNAGKGNALRQGFNVSKGDYVLLLDGDLDILPEKLAGFFDILKREQCDIVIGSKRHPHSVVQYPWHRRLASWLYFTWVHWFIGLPVTDTQTGMKLFKRNALGEALARMLVKTYAFDLELLSIAHQRGAKICEAPVEIRFGEKFGALRLKTIRDMVYDTLAVFYRLRILKYYAKVEVPPPLDHELWVTVVIACPCDSWMLQECLQSLANQTYRNFDVIVLPDAECKLSEYNFDLQVIPTGKVRPAEKRNLGIDKARGEVVAFIDDDAFADEHWLECAIKYFSNPDIGGVGGPGVTPANDSFWAKASGRVYASVLVSGGYRYRYVAGRVLCDVDDYPSCNLLVRTDLLRSFGGYRTDFWPGEDTLLCRSLVCDLHKRLVYDPWTIVFHHRRALFAPHLRQLGRYAFHRGYFVKRFPENSFHLAYFVPSLFVLYLLMLAAFTVVNFVYPFALFTISSEVLLWIFASPFCLYLSAVVVSSFAFNPLMWLLTACGIVVSHLWYGVRFIQGLFASCAPCEYIGKDHVV